MAVGITGSLELVATTPSSAKGGLKYRLNYREDYDIAGNWSTLTITSIEVYVPSGYYYGSTWYPDGIVSINGVDTKTFNSVSGGSSVYVSANDKWFTVSNSSFTSARINHDTDGKKTITLAVRQRGLSTFAFSGGSYSGWGANGSKSITLTTIPRASSLDIPSEAIMGASASFKITPASSSFRHTLTYKVGNKSDTIGTNLETSKTWSVPDLCSYIANGQTSATITYTLITYNNGTEIGRTTKDGTIKMPAKTSASVPSFTMGTKGRITFSKNLSSFVTSVSYSFGSASATIVSKTGEGYVDFTPSTDLGNQIPNSMSGKGTITVSTYANSSSGSGTTLVGSNTYDFNLSVPSSAKPSASWQSAGIANDNPIVNGWGVAVKGFTKYSWNVSASGIYGSTIKSFAFSFGSLTSSSNNSSTAVFNAAGTFVPTMIVTDTRGQQTKIEAAAVVVYDYAAPQIVSSNAYRSGADGTPAEDGTYITVWLNGKTDYSCGGHNSVTIQRRTKPTTGDWSEWVDIPNNTPTIIEGYSIDTSYQVEMRVVDGIGGTTGVRSVTVSIPTASVVMHFRDGGKGAAFFGYAQEDGLLDVIGDVKANNYRGLVNSSYVDRNFVYYNRQRSDSPSLGSAWYLKISTPKWNGTSEAIKIRSNGDNAIGETTIHTGARSSQWWGEQRSYNTTGVFRVKVVISDSCDVYVGISARCNNVEVFSTFTANISIVSAFTDGVNVPDGGFFGNEIHVNNIYAGGHSSPIGTIIKDVTVDKHKVDSRSETHIAGIRVPAGVWDVTASWFVHDATARYMGCGINGIFSTDTGGNSTQKTTDWAIVTAHRIVETSTDADLFCTAWSPTAVAASASRGSITAERIA